MQTTCVRTREHNEAWQLTLLVSRSVLSASPKPYHESMTESTVTGTTYYDQPGTRQVDAYACLCVWSERASQTPTDR